MKTPLRIASIAAALSLALSTAASAATIRLVPLSPPRNAGASIGACAVPFASAAVSAAAPADLPAIAAGQNITGITEVRIVLDPSGRLASESVLASSGNRWIDRAAITAARQSSYRAEIRACAPVGGAYGLVVDFTR
jgi:TonB family protein